ncbi:MAG TPA: alcohol dehydrogenase catalytic domain-containing protein, partial [bacterium]|nr:alcohol dehydrogenase catalytic domain-containing protein [bacterium]
MKAAVYVSKDTIEMQDLPIPKPGVGEILLKVTACGICGTDCHILAGEVPLAKPPVVLGHEICGTVAELGK